MRIDEYWVTCIVLKFSFILCTTAYKIEHNRLRWNIALIQRCSVSRAPLCCITISLRHSMFTVSSAVWARYSEVCCVLFFIQPCVHCIVYNEYTSRLCASDCHIFRCIIIIHGTTFDSVCCSLRSCLFCLFWFGLVRLTTQTKISTLIV